jgi:hypothetical protein
VTGFDTIEVIAAFVLTDRIAHDHKAVKSSRSVKNCF